MEKKVISLILIVLPVVFGFIGYEVGIKNQYQGIVNVGHQTIIGGRTFIYSEPEMRVLNDGFSYSTWFFALSALPLWTVAIYRLAR